MAVLDRATPSLDLATRNVYVAINRQYGKIDDPLADGDEVALFPPVSGGTVQDRTRIGRMS